MARLVLVHRCFWKVRAMCALLLCLCNNKLKEDVTQMMTRLSQQKQGVHGFYKADSRRCFQHVTSVGTTWKMPKIESTEMVPWPSWLRRGANNAKISSSILLGTIKNYLGVWRSW